MYLFSVEPARPERQPVEEEVRVVLVLVVDRGVAVAGEASNENSVDNVADLQTGISNV